MKRSNLGILVDLILVLLTGGAWLFWIAIRFLRRNTPGTENRSALGILFDCILSMLTAGIWFIWILIKYMRNH